MTMTFKEFVMSQPTDREIDHGDWSSCAVGDYVREVLNETLTHYEFEPNMVEEMVEEIVQDRVLRESLDCNGSTLFNTGPDLYMSGLTVVIHTYGDIQDYYNGKLELVEDDLVPHINALSNLQPFKHFSDALKERLNQRGN